MPTLDDRVTHVQGRMTDLREEMRRGFGRIDDRFAQIDARFGHFDARLLSLEQKVDRQFVWLVGIQLTTMLTVVGPRFSEPLEPSEPSEPSEPTEPTAPIAPRGAAAAVLYSARFFG